MKRWLKWVIALIVLLAVVAVGARVLKARQQAAAPVASAPLALELAPADLLVVQMRPLTRTLNVSEIGRAHV